MSAIQQLDRAAANLRDGLDAQIAGLPLEAALDALLAGHRQAVGLLRRDMITTPRGRLDFNTVEAYASATAALALLEALDRARAAAPEGGA